jgi:hypothetical protein
MDTPPQYREAENSDIRLNLLCLSIPIAAYLLLMNVGGRLLGLAILGLWSLYIWAIPVIGFWALIQAFIQRKSPKNRNAALCFCLGHCFLALYIYRDLINSP